jgi:hypothetical protein
MRMLAGSLRFRTTAQLAKQRASNGFSSIADVTPRSELEAIAKRCNRLGGFDKSSLSSNAA